MTVAELGERMSSTEFTEWMILERIEPFGEIGDYYRAGTIASVLANIHRGTDTLPFKPTDFFPSIFEEDKKPAQTPEEIHDFMKMMQAALQQKAGNA